MTHLDRSARRGFSLLEMAIVLGIIALIAGVGIKMAGGSLKAADRVTTQERLAAIKTALDSFSKTYGYLPCPANRSLLATNVNFGVEKRSVVTPTTCVASAPGLVQGVYGWFGAVPVRTLGLPDYYAADAWGNKFTYAVSDYLKSSPAIFSLPTSQALAVRYGNRTNWYYQSLQYIQLSFSSVADNGVGAARVTVPGSAPATGTLVHMAGNVYKGSYAVSNISATQFDLNGSTYSSTDSGTLEWQQTGSGSNAAYVVVSHGPDGRGAFPMAGTSIPGNKLCNSSATANTSPPPCTSSATTSCTDIENCNDDYIFYDTVYNDGPLAGTYFDDYVVWGSNALQRTPVSTNLYTSCPAGTCEAWCATCAMNYPGATSAAPPAGITNPFLYKKVVSSNSTTCSASCFWGGFIPFINAACPSGNCYVGAP